MDNLDRLFRLYHRELQQIAYRRLGDREMAADLTQDAFVRYVGLDRQQRTHSIANPRFFLIRVLRNLIIDLGRSRTGVGRSARLTRSSMNCSIHVRDPPRCSSCASN